MKCVKCGKQVEKTFRTNKKGEPGIFWCIECCLNGGISIESNLYEVTKLIDECINNKEEAENE